MYVCTWGGYENWGGSGVKWLYMKSEQIIEEYEMLLIWNDNMYEGSDKDYIEWWKIFIVGREIWVWESKNILKWGMKSESKIAMSRRNKCEKVDGCDVELMKVKVVCNDDTMNMMWVWWMVDG